MELSNGRAAVMGLPWWTLALPLLGAGALAVGAATLGVAITGALLIGAVLAAVHHAEVVALKVGEPFGTLILAVAVTVIEAGLIISLMLAGGDESVTVARDTVFAAVMIILNGIVGLCLLIGALRHFEQSFSEAGVSAALAVLATLAVMTLVLPNHTLTTPGPIYAPSQLGFVGAASLALYLMFAFVQTVRHRAYFLSDEDDDDGHADPPPTRTVQLAFALLLVALVAVILLAKALAPSVKAAVAGAGLPAAMVGVAIAAIVLAPEGLAAVRAARRDRLQTSMNLALGSALATIGLTIPVVAVTALWFGMPLALGLDPKATVLLLLSLFVAALAFSTGRTTVLQGAVHLVIFAVYLFTTLVP